MQSSLDWIKYDTGSKDNLLDESGFYQMFQSELQTGMKCFFKKKNKFWSWSYFKGWSCWSVNTTQ